jgi:Protein required for attachment to host cells
MKKHPSFLIVADRGRLIAYTCESKRPQGSVPRMVAEVTFSEAHQRLSEQVTDQAGSFPDLGTAGRGNAAAERMSLIEEIDVQNFRRVGNCINHVLSSHHPVEWGFAAPSEINRAILEFVKPEFTGTLAQNVLKDLTRVPADKVAERFEAA